MLRLILSALVLLPGLGIALPAAAEIPPIRRVLPPQGLEIPADVRQRLETKLAATKRRLEAWEKSARKRNEQDPERRLALLIEHKPDVEVFLKAVEFALLHREFYVPKDFDKADWALDQANERLDALEKDEAPWTKAKGLVVRGYVSFIDDSVQPYGLVIPKDHDFSKPCPLYVWLHGRGDKNTDLHFLYERATRVGQIAPPGAIVLHPFGRHCVGWKHAGEWGVLEAMADVFLGGNYQIDEHRVVLIGFSMGGAGAWHIGAHYTDRFVAVSPGAGFAETARYQRLTPDRYPAWYEQKLWGQYDVPGYVRNLFNTEVIAYSGELDRQIQAARVMEQAYREEGRVLTHLIGPGVEHKYEPKTLEDLLQRLAGIVSKGRDQTPPEVHIQTRTLAYNEQKWAYIDGLREHWQDSRVDAQIVGQKRIKVATKNITSLRLSPWKEMEGTVVEIDGQSLTLLRSDSADHPNNWLQRTGDHWELGRPSDSVLRKRWPQQGPIDHAFMRRFLVVTPSGKSRNARFQQWMDFELEHFRQRWRALMRGNLPEIRDVDLTDREIALRSAENLILWGDADSNQVIRRLRDQLPVKSIDGKWEFGGQTYEGDTFVPTLIFPRTEPTRRMFSCLVLNSGLTFREGHDRTNSLQNPKLPDWAIIDITQPPDALSPGRIHDAGFFDEQWKLKSQPQGP
jgi:pimeloyl-ACP methyl ester carboxylesterase